MALRRRVAKPRGGKVPRRAALARDDVIRGPRDCMSTAPASLLLDPYSRQRVASIAQVVLEAEQLLHLLPR